MRVRRGAGWLVGGALLAIGVSRLPGARGEPRPGEHTAAAPSPPPPAAPSSPPRLALVKPAPAGGSTFPWIPDYLRVLERFPLYHAQHWHDVPGQGEKLGYFGGGARAGAVAQARALLAIAFLAAEPGYDPRPSGISAATLRAQAQSSLRDLLRTHLTGDMDRVGGGRWGGDSAAWLAVGPLVEASRLLRGPSNAPDTTAVERVVAAEADRLLKEAPAAGLPRESRAAENAAAADCLAWAVALLPKHADAPRWAEQEQSFAMNALSAPQDRASDAGFGARREREWVTTENLLPDFLLESGGAVNPDAELGALASLSDGYYAHSSAAQPVPAALTHHDEEAWDALRRFWLGGHRFARPAGAAAPAGAGGDLALFPVCALLEGVGSEPSVARLIERSCFQALEAAQIARGDGSFRGGGEAVEAEAAAALAQAALIHRQPKGLVAPASAGPLRAQLAGVWTSPAAALAVGRSPDCFASWAWRSVGDPEAPVGLFVPLDAEDLAAWEPNQLTGSFDLQGFTAARTLRHRERPVEGGFTATGEIDEGENAGRPGLRHFVAFAALPARRIAVLFDLAIAAQAVTVTRSEGLRLGVASAAPGGAPHVLRSEEGEAPLPGDGPASPPPARTIASSWLNIDDRLGVAALYSQQPFTVRSEPAAPSGPAGLPSEVIDTPFSTQPTPYQAGQIARDTVMLLVAADTAATARLAQACAVLPTGNELARAVEVQGADGQRCLVVANFGLKETWITLAPPDGPPLSDLRLAPLDTRVLELAR